MMQALQYPVGSFVLPTGIEQATLQAALKTLNDFPAAVEELLQEAGGKLEQAYRPGGWNIRQLIHHCADSHLNAFIRVKLALTEDTPVIKPYDEQAWALLPDYDAESLPLALQLLRGVHGKWVRLLYALSSEQLQRSYYHPASEKYFTIAEVVMLYEWHCRHHLAHMRLALATPAVSLQ